VVKKIIEPAISVFENPHVPRERWICSSSELPENAGQWNLPHIADYLLSCNGQKHLNGSFNAEQC
jgi:hypothetical protein